MRIFLLTLTLFISLQASGQKNCQCENDTLLREIISCDTVSFNNHAKLFWGFNCDSSWLTFQSPAGKRTVIFSLGDGLQELTGRLGFSYSQEFKSSFLIENRRISGCCVPLEYFLFNKSTGKQTSAIGSLVFLSENKKLPFGIGITSTTKKKADEYNALTIYNFDNGKRYSISLPKGEITKAVRVVEPIAESPEYLFEEPEIHGTVVVLKYQFKKIQKNDDKDAFKTITIDLNKYTKQ